MLGAKATIRMSGGGAPDKLEYKQVSFMRPLLRLLLLTKALPCSATHSISDTLLSRVGVSKADSDDENLIDLSP